MVLTEKNILLATSIRQQWSAAVAQAAAKGEEDEVFFQAWSDALGVLHIKAVCGTQWASIDVPPELWAVCADGDGHAAA